MNKVYLGGGVVYQGDCLTKFDKLKKQCAEKYRGVSKAHVPMMLRSESENEREELKDKLVSLIEPILERYKKSLKDNPSIDYRNFAAHDIANIVIATHCTKPS